MRLIQISHDWKASVDGEELTHAFNNMSQFSKIHVYNVPQDDCDEYVLYMCSEELTLQQVMELWNEGDLSIGDKEFWEADDFPQLLEAVKKYNEQDEIEQEGVSDGEGI